MPDPLAASVVIDADIPGGNVFVEGIEGDTVFFRPDLRDTRGEWFYWSFRVRGVAGRSLRFLPTRPNLLTSLGPAISLDGGWTWQWTRSREEADGSFRIGFPAGHDEARLAMGMPYTRRNLSAFLDRHPGHPRLHAGTLCRSRKGRDVPMLRVRDDGAAVRQRVLVTARHHCCEMMASYVLEGMLASLLREGGLPRGVEYLFIPFVDADGVEEGDQGKNRRPRDHNRDYDGESIYPETAAIREQVPRWSDGALRVALDLHCPWIRGPHEEVLHLVGSSSPEMWRQQQAFSHVLEEANTSLLPYHPGDDVPFGLRWNTADNYVEGISSSRWAADLPGCRLAVTLEVPYAVARGAELNQQSARSFGGAVAAAVGRYLQSCLDG